MRGLGTGSFRFVGLFILLSLSMSMGLACRSGDSSSDSGEPVGEPEERPVRYEVQPAVCETRCLTPAPSAEMYPRLLITHVRYGSHNEVRLWNVSGDAIDLSGWTVCVNTANCRELPAMVVPQRGRLVVRLTHPGTSAGEFINLGSPEMALDAVGEISFFASSDMNADQMRAYVRWGTAATGSSHESIAIEAGIWHWGAYVPICEGPDFSGFYATGNVARPVGFRNAVDACFTQ